MTVPLAKLAEVDITKPIVETTKSASLAVNGLISAKSALKMTDAIDAKADTLLAGATAGKTCGENSQSIV